MSCGPDRLVVRIAGALLIVAVAAGGAAAQPTGAPAPVAPTAPAPVAPVATAPAAAPVRAGLFLRAHVGLELTRVTVTDDSDFEQTIVGRGPGMSVEVGISLTRRWVLYGELFQRGATELKVEEDGEIVGTLDDHAISQGGVGFGLAHYWPSNAYLGVTLGLANLTFTFPEEWDQPERETDHGANLTVRVGQDWWVADDWTFGLAAQLSFGTASENEFGIPVDYETSAVSLGVALTRN